MSTADVVTVIIKFVYQTLGKNGEARVAALDMSKAFDRVWHADLLRNLKGYGDARQFGLMEALLTNRVIKVVLNGHAFRLFHINGGFPMALSLGFINELLDVINSQLDVYANGVTIYACLNSKSDKSEKK